MNNANVKTCSSCGEAQELDVAFCTNCGSRFKKKEKQDVGDGSLIGTQLLELANDFLSVREVSPARFVFSSQTGAQAPVEKVKIKFDAVAQLEPEKKLLMFWEQMVESSVGMNAGSIGEKKVQKGIAVTQKTHGHILFGGKYGFEYGKLREVVKAIAITQGWKFKTVIFKPKRMMDTGDVEPEKSMPVLKILVLVLALLLIIALGAIGYLYFSSRPKDMPPVVQQSTPTRSQTKLENSDPKNTDKADINDKMKSSERKVLRKQGTVAGGKPLIETDRKIYNAGEKIRVHFYNAPGHSRDWICIVPADSRDTEAGDYQYIPREERGVLTFKSPQPGRYEARAYYSYSPGRYVVSARYGFTVQNR